MGNCSGIFKHVARVYNPPNFLSVVALKKEVFNYFIAVTETRTYVVSFPIPLHKIILGSFTKKKIILG
jgi:hypothetical protein